MRILIAEDERPFQIIYERIVQPIKAAFKDTVITVTDRLAEVMEIVAGHPSPDIVILDLNLKDSGMEHTIARLHEIEEHSPLIIVTGYDADFVRSLIKSIQHYEIVSKSEDHSHKGVIPAMIRAFNSWHSRRYDAAKAHINRMKEIIIENGGEIH